jgi:hypothetical protein
MTRHYTLQSATPLTSGDKWGLKKNEGTVNKDVCSDSPDWIGGARHLKSASARTPKIFHRDFNSSPLLQPRNQSSPLTIPTSHKHHLSTKSHTQRWRKEPSSRKNSPRQQPNPRLADRTFLGPRKELGVSHRGNRCWLEMRRWQRWGSYFACFKLGSWILQWLISNRNIPRD